MFQTDMVEIIIPCGTTNDKKRIDQHYATESFSSFGNVCMTQLGLLVDSLSTLFKKWLVVSSFLVVSQPCCDEDGFLAYVAGRMGLALHDRPVFFVISGEMTNEIDIALMGMEWKVCVTHNVQVDSDLCWWKIAQDRVIVVHHHQGSPHELHNI
ncbi:uncharacterized protein EAE97_001187 [Botrytis byssoidea]|uniref:Uncharacterized protein n=1 Tax=Botrytis byssoidea TaxID=139641 RepID=A0A9P5IXS2_9HELO|nr:uncharacterized protein EAE97_001187 [Botrytis byssoidea]KAF7953788.1 hypothetical protein EAE97_001187 [Botrytis byssoidea]